MDAAVLEEEEHTVYRTFLGFRKPPSPLSKKSDLRDAIVAVYEKAKAKGWRHVGVYNLSRPIYIPVDIGTS
ncbi:hypothetical protein NQ318_005483 [Aromia moschata]|uniref:Uncharacterized protein n=1 Tax=Aromia moschata TaxID=1265417 RepID=A0AAV8XQI2_9CUCU|nr:hypothetical protein NQ318_005483 [Aromia moschata]